MSNLSRVPLWIRKQHLIPGTYAPGSGEPSAHDIEVFVAALSGVDKKDLKSRFDLLMADIVVSIKTVRDAVKRGEVPEAVTQAHPWVVGVITGKKGKQNKKDTDANWLVDAISGAAMHLATETSLAIREPGFVARAEQHEAIAHITDQPYERLDRSRPGALPEFLTEVKTRFAVAAAPVTLRRLAEDVIKGRPRAVTEAREFLYGRQTGGPLVALQQNFGGPASPDGARSTPAFNYEDVILKYEAEHPEESGEVTKFSESLLEGQEEETE